MSQNVQELIDERNELRARLAAVEALCAHRENEGRRDLDIAEVFDAILRAAARGDAQDRAAEGHVWLRPQWVCSRCGIAYAGGNPPCRPQRSGSEDRPA
jgi:rubrerythrin